MCCTKSDTTSLGRFYGETLEAKATRMKLVLQALESSLEFLPMAILHIILCLSGSFDIPCPHHVKPCTTYVFFIGNIRKWHNYYLHCNIPSLRMHYLHYLIECMTELLTSPYPYPNCFYRDDCRDTRCSSCENQEKIRENTVTNLGLKIRQICAKIRRCNNPQSRICQICNQEKSGFHSCYHEQSQQILLHANQFILEQFQ